MIARIWHGRTPAAKGEAYFEYVMESGVKAFRETKGNQGAFVLRRVSGDVAEFLTISLWDSYESIRAFAGPQFEKARYFDKDREFLLEFEPNVAHYEVLSKPPHL